MADDFKKTTIKNFLIFVTAPTLLGTFGLYVAAYMVLIWASASIDSTEAAREAHRTEHIISELRTGIAREQESVTIWGDAVKMLHMPDGEERSAWLDANLGGWMHSYFGHDAAYILSPTNTPIFASFKGERQAPAAYKLVETSAQPLVNKLRKALLSGDEGGVSDGMRSPGASDFVRVDGHPAFLSVKPIVPETGDLKAAGESYLHVALRFVDGDMLQTLAHEHALGEMRFSPSPTPLPGESKLSLMTEQGDLLGYLFWEPYKPGAAFMKSIEWLLFLTGVIFFVVVTTLLAAIYYRLIATRNSEERIRASRLRDPLTQLPNRLGFRKLLDETLADGASEQGFGLVYVGLDRFKQVNDALGPEMGDHVLREAAARIGRLTRDLGTLSRVGGDEFAFIMKGAKTPTCETLARKVVEVLDERFDVGDSHACVSGSVGVVMVSSDDQSRSELGRKAGIALHAAKAAGGARVAVFGHHMDNLIHDRLEVERALRTALADKQQFTVVYQPKYEAKTHQITGVEALVRWQHPARGPISPAVFIPIAEETGLINDLGHYVLTTACQTAAKWPLAKVAVNVSAVQLKEASFAASVAEVLSLTQLAPGKLELELTETAWLDDSGDTSSNLGELRELGVKIALDDFGTGFSSLGRLRESHVDRIKIDQSFVRGIGQSDRDEAIVRAIVDLAKANRLEITAEGVETTVQSEFLYDIGCDELQGYLFSRPIVAEKVEALLASGTDRTASITPFQA